MHTHIAAPYTGSAHVLATGSITYNTDLVVPIASIALGSEERGFKGIAQLFINDITENITFCGEVDSNGVMTFGTDEPNRLRIADNPENRLELVVSEELGTGLAFGFLEIDIVS